MQSGLDLHSLHYPCRFLSEGHPWNVKIVESTHELTPSAVADAVRDGTEGFIISLLDPEKNLAALAESSTTP